MDGIWIGDNAVVALTPKLQVVFLRLKPDNVICIAKEKNTGIVGVIYGCENESYPHCESYILNRDHHLLIDKHNHDKIEVRDNTLTYIVYDGTTFKCTLADDIIMGSFIDDDTKDSTKLTVAQKLELWSLGTKYEFTDSLLIIQIVTRRYSIVFRSFKHGNILYARVGVNGYCDKGLAMLPIVCLRDGVDPKGKVIIQKEVRMFNDIIEARTEYKPNAECFADDSCVAFPSNGGWYWSIKEVTDEYIKLHSCGGEEDIRYRNRNGLLEIVV